MKLWKRLLARKNREEKSGRVETLYQRLLFQHQSKFRCVICDAPSDGPAYMGISPISGYDRWMTDMEGDYGEEPDWDTPSNLKQCMKCGRFYCTNHRGELLQGGCKQCCAEQR